MTSRGGVALAATIGAASLLLACGGADNVYVADEDTGVYLRLPKDWTVFEVEDGNANVNPRTDPSSGPWSVIFDSSAEPRRSHIDEAAPAAPVGEAIVLHTLRTEIPRSHAGLRAALAGGVDPLVSPPPDLRVVSYDEIEVGDAWGVRMIVESTTPGAESTHLRMAFFDDGGNRLMTLFLGCSAACYTENAEEIEAIADTFTIEGPT